MIKFPINLFATKSILTLVCLVAFGASFASVQVVRSFVTSDTSIEENMDTGSYLNIIFIGSYLCPWSTMTDAKELIRNTNDAMKNYGDSLGYKVYTTGISVDRDVDEGYSYLKSVYNFDEMVVGLSWLNLGSRKYVWEEYQSDQITPQVLVVGVNLTLEPYVLEMNDRMLYQTRTYEDIDNLYKKALSYDQSIIE